MDENIFYIIKMGTVFLTSYSRFDTDTGWYPVISLDPTVSNAYRMSKEDVDRIHAVIGGEAFKCTETYEAYVPTPVTLASLPEKVDIVPHGNVTGKPLHE